MSRARQNRTDHEPIASIVRLEQVFRLGVGTDEPGWFREHTAVHRSFDADVDGETVEVGMTATTHRDAVGCQRRQAGEGPDESRFRNGVGIQKHEDVPCLVSSAQVPRSGEPESCIDLGDQHDVVGHLRQFR